MPLTFPELTPLQALHAMSSATTPTLLDVRLPEDQDGSTIPGACAVAFDDLEAQIAVSPNGAIVICHKGLKISAGVTARLRLNGIAAHRLQGGHVGWGAAGLPFADAPAPARIAVPLEANPHETLCAWATSRFTAPRAEVLEVPRDDLAGVCDRFAASSPSDLPNLPGLTALNKALDTIALALRAAPPSDLFPTFDLAFRGALCHEIDTRMSQDAAQEART